MSTRMTTIDPALYRRMSEPFESVAEATEAVEAFMAEVRAAREKHGIRDVSFVWQFGVCGSDGKESEYLGSAHIGDVAREVAMRAWALGRAEADFVEGVTVARKAGAK